MLELEVSDLRYPLPGHFSVASLSPLARQVPLRQRIWCLTLLTTLALLALPALDPSLPARVTAAFPAGVAASNSANIPPGVLTKSAIQISLGDEGRWTQLAQRPLHLPVLAAGAPCPAVPARVFAAGLSPALGSGPAYAIAAGDDNGTLLVASATSLHLPGRDWGGQLVVWYFDPQAQGPVLIRGGQLDGAGLVRFNGGLDQQSYVYNLPAAPLLSELRLDAVSNSNAPGVGWPSYTRLRTPGCYAYQVDGLTFSEVIVFKAAFAP